MDNVWASSPPRRPEFERLGPATHRALADSSFLVQLARNHRLPFLPFALNELEAWTVLFLATGMSERHGPYANPGDRERLEILSDVVSSLIAADSWSHRAPVARADLPRGRTCSPSLRYPGALRLLLHPCGRVPRSAGAALPRRAWISTAWRRSGCSPADDRNRRSRRPRISGESRLAGRKHASRRAWRRPPGRDGCRTGPMRRREMRRRSRAAFPPSKSRDGSSGPVSARATIGSSSRIVSWPGSRPSFARSSRTGRGDWPRPWSVSGVA